MATKFSPATPTIDNPPWITQAIPIFAGKRFYGAKCLCSWCWLRSSL